MCWETKLLALSYLLHKALCKAFAKESKTFAKLFAIIIK
jgi:hypothetical protein